MQEQKQMDIKPLFRWAKDEGETKIVDRVLLKLMPLILQTRLVLTQKQIEMQPSVLVPYELYVEFKKQVEQIVGKPYKGESDV